MLYLPSGVCSDFVVGVQYALDCGNRGDGLTHVQCALRPGLRMLVQFIVALSWELGNEKMGSLTRHSNSSLRVLSTHPMFKAFAGPSAVLS